MVDPAAFQVADTQIRIAIAKDQEALALKVNEIRSEAAANGHRGGSMPLLLAQRASQAAIEGRVSTAWKTIHRCVTSAGVENSEGLSNTLFSELAKHFPEEMVLEFEQHSTRPGPLGQGTAVPEQIARALHETRDQALRHARSEIDLFVLSLQKKRVEAGYSPQFHFSHSTVGAIQTGSNSTANVTQSLAPENAELARVLAEVASALRGAGDIDPARKSEALELIDSAEEEVRQENPKPSRLRAYLRGISEVLATSANAKAAYELLQAAGKHFGVDL